MLGVLCVHGFTATPFEMSFVGERLQRAGFTVAAPLLAGHGATPDALDATTWRDWYATVERAFDELRARCHAVAVAGQSLGGLLVLHLARQRGRELAALASLGAPLWLPRPVDLAVRVLDRLGVIPFLPHVPKRGGPDLSDREMAARTPNLAVFPPRATRSLWELAGLVRAEIDNVSVPALIAHARHDHVAPPACAAELHRRLASRDKRLVWFERSFHILPLDVEKDAVAGELERFFRERMAACAT